MPSKSFLKNLTIKPKEDVIKYYVEIYGAFGALISYFLIGGILIPSLLVIETDLVLINAIILGLINVLLIPSWDLLDRNYWVGVVFVVIWILILRSIAETNLVSFLGITDFFWLPLFIVLSLSLLPGFLIGALIGIIVGYSRK